MEFQCNEDIDKIIHYNFYILGFEFQKLVGNWFESPHPKYETCIFILPKRN